MAHNFWQLMQGFFFCTQLVLTIHNNHSCLLIKPYYANRVCTNRCFKKQALYLYSVCKRFLKTQFTHSNLLPERYFSRRSQIDRLEYGSTPEVGSSKTTTFASPTKAMATDSFLCIPPTRGQRHSGI